MWFSNSDELRYFEHYERELFDDVTKQRLLVRDRIFAASNEDPKTRLKNAAMAPLRFLSARLRGLLQFAVDCRRKLIGSQNHKMKPNRSGDIAPT